MSNLDRVLTIKTRVKTARGRKLSSTRWLHRHLNDQYVQKINKDGYRSRSAYKLIEIDSKFKLLQEGQKVVDLGAYPGGWSQVASKKAEDVFAIDIKPMDELSGVEFIECDINEIKILKEKFKDQKFDVILSDMAPGTSGLKLLDHIRIMLLCEAALNFAKHFLNSGGKFVVKIFQGESDKDFYNKLKKMFKIVKYFKPKSSRSESTEIYLVSLGFTDNETIEVNS
ncbi:MAG: RlmE family RNA methyltransferase [Wolbachia sp.]|nr:RlmE family RNA methyltransferase [Wolbachia sp.]MDD9335828.1 RlmE family RNA methyltransferase [Wolbachia sp.]